MAVPIHKVLLLLGLLCPAFFGVGYWLGRGDQRLDDIQESCEEIAERLKRPEMLKRYRRQL